MLWQIEDIYLFKIIIQKGNYNEPVEKLWKVIMGKLTFSLTTKAATHARLWAKWTTIQDEEWLRFLVGLRLPHKIWDTSKPPFHLFYVLDQVFFFSLLLFCCCLTFFENEWVKSSKKNAICIHKLLKVVTIWIVFSQTKLKLNYLYMILYENWFLLSLEDCCITLKSSRYSQLIVKKNYNFSVTAWFMIVLIKIQPDIYSYIIAQFGDWLKN